MAEIMSNNRPNAYAQFEKWLSGQPYWLQDAAYRIYHGLEIDEAQISAYVDMCVAQVKKEKTEFNRLAQNEVNGQEDYSRMSVLRLFQITGVNALAPEATLEFEPEGVTVVYGLNGSGKSGFMRMFKHLSGSPYEETIQPNVFKKNDGVKPSCRFIIQERNQDRTIICDLSSNAKDTPLAKCDVFDSRISNNYITKDNSVSYQPFVFTVLSRLAAVATAISKHIDRCVESVPSISISIPDELSERDEIGWVKNLNASTMFPAQYFNWTEDQKKAYEEIPKQLDTDKVVSDLRFFKAQLSSISPVLDDLTAANDSIHNPELTEAYKAVCETKRRLDVAEKLFAETADNYDKVSVDVSDWKELWRIAQSYFESTLYADGEGHFGEVGTICPLCHQKISESISERFKSVNEYVNGTCSDDYNNAVKGLTKLLTSVHKRAYSSVQQIKNQLADVLDNAASMIIINAYDSISERDHAKDIREDYTQVIAIDLSAAISILTEKKNELELQKKTLEGALEDERRASLQEQLVHLSCHKWIYDNRESIVSQIANLKKQEELVNAKQLLNTNRITLEANQLANSLITDAYIERFINELKRLAPKIRVKLEKAPSQKGSTPYRVTIDTDSGIKCKPEDILSEGEQRIVALAAFFADATGREAQTPIIIDDPISSLDINYENAATRRIVELARDRQVVVFTHRISMLVGIEDACERLSVQHKENYIRGTSKGKGVPDLEEVYHGKVKTCLNGIQARLREIKGMDPDSADYADAVGRQCQQFRICIERTVEDILLQNIVRRFDRRVMTQGIVKKLGKITEADCKIVDEMMTKYSFTEHSQPDDCPPIDIGIDELNGDISKIKLWISEFQSRDS